MMEGRKGTRRGLCCTQMKMQLFNMLPTPSKWRKDLEMHWKRWEQKKKN